MKESRINLMDFLRRKSQNQLKENLSIAHHLVQPLINFIDELLTKICNVERLQKNLYKTSYPSEYLLDSEFENALSFTEDLESYADHIDALSHMDTTMNQVVSI